MFMKYNDFFCNIDGTIMSYKHLHIHELIKGVQVLGKVSQLGGGGGGGGGYLDGKIKRSARVMAFTFLITVANEDTLRSQF